MTAARRAARAWGRSTVAPILCVVAGVAVVVLYLVGVQGAGYGGFAVAVLSGLGVWGSQQ